MINRLIVANLAVVERAEVEFCPSLNVITGETGAGKSVLMGALELILGARGEASVVREGAAEAEVEAQFDDGVIIRRTITKEGRSRAWVNDESVTIAELKEIGQKLVDVHGPTANQRLLEESYQRESLGSVDKGYIAAWEVYAKVKGELEELDQAGVSEDELELWRYQVNELESANLCEEDNTIVERHAAAAHLEEIVENANRVTEGLGGDQGAAETLIALQPKLHAMARHFPMAEEWVTKVESITIDVQELSRTIADQISRLDGGEEDFAALDQRLTLISKLERKYLKGTVDSAYQRLIAVLEEKKAKLDKFEHLDERREELQAKLMVAEKELRAQGAKLTMKRKATAEKLGKAITKELKELGFKEAKFFVAIEPGELAAHGCDKVEFMFEPNPGEPARPLKTIASSGEIARVMLALKVVNGGESSAMVFDEIDANIGGEVGKITGEKLRKAAAKHQVIAITHLPQSAVFGERHFVVSKSSEGGRTRTMVRVVEGEARVDEIARMLGGDKLTSVVRKHAEELLELPR